jgi:hypothetical protein
MPRAPRQRPAAAPAGGPYDWVPVQARPQAADHEAPRNDNNDGEPPPLDPILMVLVDHLELLRVELERLRGEVARLQRRMETNEHFIGALMSRNTPI